MVRSPVEICFGGEVAALVEHIPCADLSQPDLANRLIQGFRHENAYGSIDLICRRERYLQRPGHRQLSP
jgi:hypothetical protein